MVRTIEIPTPQNVVVLYEQASVLSRFIAALLDLGVFFIGWFVLGIVLLVIDWSVFFSLPGPTLVLISLASYVLYYVVFEVWNAGQTPGKSLLGIQVIRLDGYPLRWSDAFMRALLFLVDGLFSGGLVGVVLMQTNARTQRLGDIAAHTTVVNVHYVHSVSLGDVSNISTIDDYAVTYPQVRQLDESDMLLVKTVLLRWMRYPNAAHRQLALQLADRLAGLLQIARPEPEKTYEFLDTLLRDYIVLTR